MKFSPLNFYATRVALLCGLLLVAPKTGRAVEVYVAPLSPTEADSVSIVANGCSWSFHGLLCHVCSFYSNVTCFTIDDHTFGIAAHDYSDCQSSSCWMECSAYREIGRCELGTLEAGHYVIEVEVWESLPGPPSNYSFSFDVQDSPTAVRTTPSSSALITVVPNPFASSARIEFSTDKRARATLQVYDVRGSRVRTLVDQVMDASGHTAEWDGRDATGRQQPSGVYFARLTVDGVPVGSQRIVLLR